MSITSRLDRVTHNLSPLQRAVLILQALREGREPDPELRRFEDEVQRRAFSRYMGLLWVANHQLGAQANTIVFRIEGVEDALFHYRLLKEAAEQIEEQVGEGPAKPMKGWRTGKADMSVQVFLRSLAEESRAYGAALLQQLWSELICLEAVWAELAAEFGGEDPVLPENREVVESAHRRLREAATALRVRRLANDVSADLMERLRAAVDDAFRAFGIMEVYA